MRALVVSELARRIRRRRWWAVLALWTLVLFGITYLVWSLGRRAAPGVELGPVMFGTLMLFTLALVCLVVPSLTSTAINGERDAGTLAVLQATLLRPYEIYLAKLVAGLAVSGAFLAASLPVALWAVAEGGVPPAKVVVAYAVLAAQCVLLLAAGLFASARLARPALSAVASYTFVFALAAGTFVLFGFAALFALRADPGQPPGAGGRWLLLAPNPFVMLADTTPAQRDLGFGDPLSALRELVRASRATTVEGPEPPPLWPAGLALQVALAAAMTWAGAATLRVPVRRLPPGRRIA